MAFYFWLKEQAPDAPYCFRSTTNCAMCQFARGLFSRQLNYIGAGESYVQIRPNGGEHIIMVPIIEDIFGPVTMTLVRCGTLGELHDKLTPILAPWMSPPLLPKRTHLTDSEMDALETRPLVSSGTPNFIL